jgi:hypothetical protein
MSGFGNIGGDGGSGGSSALPIIAGNWFMPDGMQFTQTGAAMAASTTMGLAPFYLRQQCTINNLATKVMTVGTSLTQLGIYASSSTTGLPIGAALTTSAQVANTALGPLTATVTALQLSPGYYYFAVQQNDAVVAYLAPPNAPAMFCNYPGAPALSSLTNSAANASICPGLNFTVSAFGTFPTLTGASSFTYVVPPVALRLAVAFLSVQSVP